MEDSSFQPSIGQFNYAPEMPKKPKKFIYLLILLFIVVGFLLTRNIFSGSKQEKEAPITPTPTEFQFPTDAPTPSAEPSGSPETSPTASTVNSVDKSTGLDRANLSVEIQNGSGETGVAGKASTILKDFGYKVVSAGNADSFDYVNATIKVKSTKANYLALLKKDLGFSYTVGSTSADLSSDSSADAVVIIGK